ncbi:MAG TPA: hypothetical protein VIY86_13130 [Pirellulaceae bacterium]
MSDRLLDIIAAERTGAQCGMSQNLMSSLARAAHISIINDQ